MQKNEWTITRSHNGNYFDVWTEAPLHRNVMRYENTGYISSQYKTTTTLLNSTAAFPCKNQPPGSFFSWLRKKSLH